MYVLWAMSQDPSHSAKKANTGKYNLMKLKGFFTASGTIKRRHSAEWSRFGLAILMIEG